MATVTDVLQWLDAFAPFATQEEYDNAGLLLGRPDAEVRRILFTLDATKAAVAEAIQSGAELIVSHHPLMFNPIRQLRYDQGEGAVLQALATSGISLIAAHTNLDRCDGGMADSLAQALELETVKPSADCPYLRTGTMRTPLQAKEFLRFVSRKLHSPARLYGDPDALLRTVAVVPGAGGQDVENADANAFVTGEIKHHELLLAVSKGIAVIDAGHYPTEFPGIAALYRRFLRDASANGWAVEAALHTQPPYPQTASEYPALS